MKPEIENYSLIELKALYFDLQIQLSNLKQQADIILKLISEKEEKVTK